MAARSAPQSVERRADQPSGLAVKIPSTITMS